MVTVRFIEGDFFVGWVQQVDEDGVVRVQDEYGKNRFVMVPDCSVKKPTKAQRARKERLDVLMGAVSYAAHRRAGNLNGGK
jgi:hypothetical protein